MTIILFRRGKNEEQASAYRAAKLISSKGNNIEIQVMVWFQAQEMGVNFFVKPKEFGDELVLVEFQKNNSQKPPYNFVGVTNTNIRCIADKTKKLCEDAIE